MYWNVQSLSKSGLLLNQFILSHYQHVTEITYSMGALNGGRAHKLEGVLENEDSSLAEVLDELEEHGGGDYSAHFISSEPDLAELDENEG